MKTVKSIGVWMDHSIAHLIEFTTVPMHVRDILSDFRHEVKADSIEKSEKHMHNKERGEMHEYYNKILKEVVDFDQILIFGPTDAKNELNSLLKSNHAFDLANVEILQTDKMTENQLYAFVRNHFSENIRLR